MRPARSLVLLLLLALITPLAACGGPPGASAWAAQVCDSLGPWRADIGSLTTRIQQQMAANTTPGQAKENLMTLFGGAADASEKARAGVVKAGVPDVTNGKKIAAAFVASLAGTRDAYRLARSSLSGVATVPTETFYQQVVKVVDKLNSDYKASSLDTSNLDSTELKNAFDQVPECR
jgi:hypothetical protein